MNKEAYIRELEYLLQDLPDQDRADALAYYIDYLDEAGPEREAEVLSEFGSPERLAAIIHSDFSGSLKEGGEFTEKGYEDERFKEPNYQLTKHLDLPEATESQSKDRAQDTADKDKNNKILKILIWVALAVFVLPILLPIAGGVISILVSIASVVLVIAAVVAVLVIVFLIAGIGVLIVGVSFLGIQAAQGVLMMGIGIVLLGMGFLVLAFSFVYYGTFMPWLIRCVTGLFKRLFQFGKGGKTA